jgi:hypothetical protein
MASRESIGILEVLDNLSTLAEADSLDEIEVNENFQFIFHKPDDEVREFYWVRAGANDLTMMAIRENFRSALKHLNGLYKVAKSEEERTRLAEGINQIMVLVGEAASKLEKFDLLFKDRIPKLSEFKDLQNFYKRIVVRQTSEIPEELLEEILPQAESVEELQGVHLLNDIDTIKRDHVYELFFMKNEADLDFYTDVLSKNLKMACDFGEYAKEYSGDDPLVQIKNWEDKGVQVLAKEVLSQTHHELGKLFQAMGPHLEEEMVSLLKRALLALMLAANPRNLLRQYSPKGCFLYFADFQNFFRELLHNREYIHYLLYASPMQLPFSTQLTKVISSMIYQIYTTGPDRSEIASVISQLAGKSKSKEKLSDFLRTSYESLKKVLENHPNGPLFKALDLLRDENKPSYDPWMMGNLPEKVAVLSMGEKKMSLLRIPAPITQERIERAVITDEFRAFLTAMVQKGQKLLYVDFQDRTSWSEHSRVKALEAISKEANFSDCFTYVNLAKDTDFYNQLSLYRDLADSNEFIQNFFLQLSDESTGYHFPTHIRKALFPIFVEKLLGNIWDHFFDKKAELNLRERLDFIEITYQLISLKIIELEKPDFVTLTSKDGLDIGSTSLVGLLATIGFGTKYQWPENSFSELRTHLFAPTLQQRERVVHSDRFSRFVELISYYEKKEGFLKHFSALFDHNTLTMEILSLSNRPKAA